MDLNCFEVQAELLVNKDQKQNHVAQLLMLVKSASSFGCMSAFASDSGLELIFDALEARLKKGLSARFVLGIDFYQTDPGVLYDLLELSEQYGNLELYMGSDESRTVFHPKVYAFEDKNGDSRVVLGSANLTRGGLLNNHELSTFLSVAGPKLFQYVSQEIDQYIRSGEVVLATIDLIDAYAVQHSEYSFQLALARKRAKFAKPSKNQSMHRLKDILDVMKLEPSEADPKISVFEEQVQWREENRQAARKQLDGISATKRLTKDKFLNLYEPLVVAEHLWHSGGLHRHRDKVADRAKVFQEALRMIQQVLDKLPAKFTPELVFGPLLEKFKDIPQAGINILTEVLHTYDRDHFAIMNQNSVSGLMLANITGFPLRPTKTTVSADKYVLFCKKGREVCAALGLKNFSELDALLNYAYWN